MQQIEALQQLRPLTEGERLDAKEAARAIVIRAEGDKPTREQFSDFVQSDYPGWLSKGVGLLLVIVFAAAGLASIFRVFTAGRNHFLESIDVGWQAAIVGVSTFVLAEFLVIASTIAMRIYFKGRERWFMAVPIAMGLAVAFTANYVITAPRDLWAYLEAFTPPAAVLFMSLIGEKVILEAIKQRHANEQAFQAALTEWKQSTADPEKSPRWRVSYANALREKIKETNTTGTGSTKRKELMATMTGHEWRAVVYREMQADEWLDNDDVATVTNGAIVTTNGNGNGHSTENFLAAPPVYTNGHS